jgi:hypothetical protein
MPRLLVWYRGTVEQEFNITEREVTIGRDAAHCDLCLHCSSVSRRHVRLFRDGATYYVEDLGSTNGTYRNGKKIRKSELTAGDMLKLGDRELQFVVEELPTETPEAASEAELDPTGEPGMPLETTSASAREVVGHVVNAVDEVRGETLAVYFLEGPRQGHTEILGEKFLSIGRAGDQVAVIAWRDGLQQTSANAYRIPTGAGRAGGYYLVHVGGKGYPHLNGVEVRGTSVVLKPGDIIAIGENRLKVFRHG